MKRYQVIPLVLAIYAIIMAVLGRENFINPATRLTSILILVGEALILIGLYYFMRKRDILRDERRKRESQTDSDK